MFHSDRFCYDLDILTCLFSPAVKQVCRCIHRERNWQAGPTRPMLPKQGRILCTVACTACRCIRTPSSLPQRAALRMSEVLAGDVDFFLKHHPSSKAVCGCGGGGGREFYFVGVKLSVVLGCWRQGAGEPVMHLTRQDCSTLNPKQLTWSRPGTVGSVDALLAETCNPVPVTPLTCFSASGSRGRSLQSTGRPQAQLLRVSLSSWELQQLQ